MPARRSPLQWFLMGLIRAYQLLISSWIQAGCRYYPSCSAYGMEAVRRHGGLAGSYLAAARIVRCNPFCLGGHDPVPDNPPRLFSRLGLGGSTTPSSSPPEASP